MLFVSLLLFPAILASAMAGPAQPITIAAASDLQWVLKDTAARFEARTGTPVNLTFGSSGNFFSQIENGAPYDLFFSADIDYANKLEQHNLAETGSLFQYAIGRIALWIPNGSPLDLNKGLELLRSPSIRKLAIASPQHAPYGRAAEAALKKSGLWPDVSEKIVEGENISQTAQLVQSGNADAGILALSLVVAPAMRGQGKYYVIPAELYPPLTQACVIVRESPHKPAAKQFVEFVKSPEIRQLFERYGFSVPRETSR